MTTVTMTFTLSDQGVCQPVIGQVAMSSIEREQAMEEINFRSNSVAAHKDDLVEGRFSR
jgi:hypothetical protein